MEAMSSWLAEADGVTISGGEPFDQPEALLHLLRAIKSRFSGDVLTFSGHAFEAVSKLLSQESGLIDALITDPYDASASQTLELRGSDNQRLHCLTNLGLERFGDYQDREFEREPRLDVMFDENGAAWFAGIPRRGDFTRLQQRLGLDGHQAVTTEDKRHVKDSRA